MIKQYDLAIIGGGPAGMAAAAAASKAGIESIVVIERADELGGILNQCIHNGFGLHIFKEELTGPEYSQRFIEKMDEAGISIMLDTMVVKAEPDKTLYAVHPSMGFITIKPKAVILAMGCRERPRGALRIPGSNAAGVFTAGTAQHFVNMDGILPGSKAVILGSGDIGLIMARRLTLEGAKVQGVYEIMDYPGGLTRNIVQCLDDFDIPLHLSTTVTKIHGLDRVEGVTVAKVDSQLKPIKGTEEYVECDTLLLSVGLIPENELTEQMGIVMHESTSGAYVDQDLETSLPGVFACGNVLHVHDLVDYVTLEGERAALSAVKYIKDQARDQAIDKTNMPDLPVKPGYGIRYVLPQHILINNLKNLNNLNNLNNKDNLNNLNNSQIDEKIQIFFRSSGRFSDALVKAVLKGKIIGRRRVVRLIPSEMESVTVKMSDLLELTDQGADIQDLIIEVEK